MYIKALSVTQVTEYIKRIFTSDVILNNVILKGEISNFKHHYSGHMYFTLKDDKCKIKCVMFKSYCNGLKFYPEDGMNVIVSGNISVYDRDGQYQVYVNSMEPDGKGALYVAYEQLKAKLESEGLFRAETKLPIPKFPKKVGVVTSSTGAAVRDIINVIKRRSPITDITIVPVLVQGVGAAEEISAAVESLNKRDDIDVIIIGRGGGSIEELWAFNEEIVARAINKSEIPIISAVGNETDFTISDFVSDLRAPTPSAAAELCVPDTKELSMKINTYNGMLKKSMDIYLSNKKRELIQNKKIMDTVSPIFTINQKRQYLDNIYNNMVSFITHKLDINKEYLKKDISNLESLNPLSIMLRGYSITYKENTKEVLSDIKDVNIGDNLDVHLKNGVAKCAVSDLIEGGLISEK